MASSALLHPTEQRVFGPDGTPQTETNTFGSLQEAKFDAKDKRLYVLHTSQGPNGLPRGIFAFDMSNPAVPVPLSGAFPLPVPQPSSTSHMAVDESEGNVYYIENTIGNPTRNVLYSWDFEGKLRQGFPETIEHFGGIAVDPLGYLWMIEKGSPSVAYKFSPDGSVIESFPLNTPAFSGGPSFDPASADMWVRGNESAFKLTASSGYHSREASIPVAANENFGAIAVDSTHKVLFARNSNGVLAYNESGGLLETVGHGRMSLFSPYSDMALDEETGTLYTLDQSSGGIGVWPGSEVPDVSLNAPTAIGHTTATFSGHVAPAGGSITGCRFEYVSQHDYKNLAVIAVEHAKGGTFSLRWHGNTGKDISFDATAAEVKEAMYGPSGDVTHQSPIVSGPAGGPWTMEFNGPMAEGAPDLGLEENALTPTSADVQVEAPFQQSPCEPPASPGSPITTPTDVSAHVTGLATGTTYRVRLSASNANGRNLSTDQVFAANPTVVATGPATEILPESAKLNGTVDPENLATTYRFEYGANTEYGESSTSAELSSAESGEKPVALPLSGLSPGTTYHYRIVAENSKGTSVGVDRTFTTAPAVKGVATEAATEVHRTDATLHGSLDPDGLATTYYFEWGKTRRYGSSSAGPPGTPAGTTSPGVLQFSAPASGLKPETTYHFRIVAVNSRGTTYGNDLTFETQPAVKDIATEAATDIGTATATLHGTLDPDGFSTTFYFQWGKTTAYGHASPLAPGEDVGTSAAGVQPVSRVLSNLEPGTTYHFRIVAVNSFGTTVGADRSFQTPQPPSIEGFFSSHVSATGAELTARVNPHGFPTTYRFEYGTTTNYGSLAPVPDGTLGPLTSAQTVSVSLSGLQGVTYHYRVIAESQWGTTATEDQNFEFNPPSCPNAGVRQQTGSAYLPDCRAYELVSPGRAGGAALLTEGPTSPSATNRLVFAGLLNAIPGSGSPPNGGIVVPAPDLYAASRTSTGWTTRYVGLSGEETLAQGGEPVRSGQPNFMNRVLASQDLSRFLTWDQTTYPGTQIAAPRSYSPYSWDNEGRAHGRLPTNFGQVPGAEGPPAEGGFLGDIAPSPDFSHYIFSSIRTAFAPGGQTEQPGSVYDNDLATGAVTVVSKTASGADIPLDPLSVETSSQLGGSAQFLKVPAVSTDGSHILMSSKAPKGVHLYMRVGDGVSYEPSLGEDGKNHGVDFAGMSADGSEVFFTTPVQMTADDHDSSIDLYRWRENGGAPVLTRISSGADGDIGDTDECNPGWIATCGVEVVPTPGPGTENPGPPRDTAIASHGGYIYFYSPEQLAPGARGVVGGRNLYLWHAGSVRFVATIEPANPIEHINVSTDGTHMGLITKSQLIAYDNNNHAEMYVFDASSGALHCVSCRPDGEPPTADVEGAQNGIFMADDGRAFFATPEALVPRDANGIVDVYEYVNGRPQLIGTGTGAESASNLQRPGLIGVGADGANAFFFTTQTLVPQDENGPFFKIYDARVNGGFPYAKPAAPCAAADECHGEGSSAPAAPQSGSGANLGSRGNAEAKAKARHRKHRHSKHRKRKRVKHRRAQRHAAAHKGAQR